MTREECRNLIAYYRSQKSLVHDEAWCRALEYALDGWDAAERNDYPPRIPPLTGTAPDDEPEAA